MEYDQQRGEHGRVGFLWKRASILGKHKLKEEKHHKHQNMPIN